MPRSWTLDAIDALMARGRASVTTEEAAQLFGVPNIGWLSAAELYGAAHQRPQVLQVAIDRHLPDRDLERVRLRFADRRHLGELPRIRRNVPTGQVWVSTPEVTALDLAADPVRSGGVSDVATVLVELTEDGQLDPGR